MIDAFERPGKRETESWGVFLFSVFVTLTTQTGVTQRWRKFREKGYGVKKEQAKTTI